MGQTVTGAIYNLYNGSPDTPWTYINYTTATTGGSVITSNYNMNSFDEFAMITYNSTAHYIAEINYMDMKSALKIASDFSFNVSNGFCISIPWTSSYVQFESNKITGYTKSGFALYLYGR